MALAVIAVTLAVIAVFAPIAFLSGVVGQFFKSFGLGVCFVMAVSLFDALTNASMLSAYLGGTHTSLVGLNYNWGRHPVQSLLIAFERPFKIGDILVFYGYQNNNVIGHLGIICEADGMHSKFIHASSGKVNSVTISELDSDHYANRFYKCIDVLSN